MAAFAGGMEDLFLAMLFHNAASRVGMILSSGADFSAVVILITIGGGFAGSLAACTRLRITITPRVITTIQATSMIRDTAHLATTTSTETGFRIRIASDYAR